MAAILLKQLFEESETSATKNEDAPTLGAEYFNDELDERTLETRLEKLGRLPEGFDVNRLVPLLRHKSPAIRLLAVKNIGKAKDQSLLETLRRAAMSENNTLVRREAVSAIGRMRTPRAIPTLVNFLHV